LIFRFAYTGLGPGITCRWEDQSHHGRESHSLAALGRTVSFCFAFSIVLFTVVWCGRGVITMRKLPVSFFGTSSVTMVSHSGQQHTAQPAGILMGDNDWAEYGHLECCIISFHLAPNPTTWKKRRITTVRHSCPRGKNRS